MPEPTSQKPYLMRALYEWCVDNGFTPYVSVVVDADTRVPMEYVRNGEIVLNIGPLAANRLKMGNEFIEFSARFGGVAKELLLPVPAVSAIYARENGHGMSFEVESRNKPGWESAAQSLGPQELRGEEPRLSDVAAPPRPRDGEDGGSDGTRPPGGPGAAGGRPALRRVK